MIGATICRIAVDRNGKRATFVQDQIMAGEKPPRYSYSDPRA